MSLVPNPCAGCRDGAALDLPIAMAFQPIVSVTDRRVHAFEALVRGADGAGAETVLSQVDHTRRYTFDQACRATAIHSAARLGVADTGAMLSINFLPNAVYNPRACIRVTLDAAEAAAFPIDRIQFEFTESERVDPAHLLSILKHYRALGFRTAVDDFGAGYAGLGLLTDFVPDVAKIDRKLVTGSDACKVRRTILRNMIAMLRDLGVTVVAEGVETAGECAVLSDLGVTLMQGYLFARPGFDCLPNPSFAALEPV